MKRTLTPDTFHNKNVFMITLNDSIPRASDFATQSEFDVILEQQRTMNEALKKLNDQVNTLPPE
ncbi:MAG: hypothetical protein HC866_18490 [Leptolyngbyaceae cyanobacterium RU_5_1]|nr:hypothetical protein [Leptolyngbyaceae cyanobacterium RU_5_1]